MAATNQWSGTLKRLKDLFASAPRPELEQAALRVAIGGIVFVYLLIYALRDREITHSELEVVAIALAFFLFAILLAMRIVHVGGHSVLRRAVGMIADNAVTSYCLIRMGEGGAVVLGVYLFVAFGNGFRYGRAHLHACQLMGLIGFGLVLIVSPFWSEHLAPGVGLLVAMIVLPFYVGTLAERIKEARDRADEANNAKGRFLANVSHEMRTPLNGVIAMADVLRETTLTESQKEIVETLGASAHLLLVQIEDVLDMAKIEAGRVQIEKQPFDLGHLLTSTLKVVLPQARYKGLDVSMTIEPEAARWLEGDSHHLRQVLLNLLANAVKFTETGTVQLRAFVLKRDEAHVDIRFEVKDTGIGIALEKQSAIFEPFAQADDSITRLYGGTGLGTTIARQLVSLMGGEIGVDSMLGVGSLFWVELRFAFSEAPAINEAVIGYSVPHGVAFSALNAQKAGNITKIRGARILVAEDNPTNQRVAELILESGGHQPTIVSNGEAALDALEKGGYDLALFDLSMPVVSGLEALKLYQFTTSKPIPILIVSANVTHEVIAECSAAGATEFIAKPIRPSILLDAIERHIAARRAEVPAALAPPPRSDDRPSLTVIDTPPVDSSVLAGLDRLSTDSTFVPRLLNGFRFDAERLVKEIVDGLAARKYEAVKDSAHALKGGAGSIGATQLMMLATRFEKASYDLLRMKTIPWTEELIRAADVALALLDRHIETHQQKAGM